MLSHTDQLGGMVQVADDVLDQVDHGGVQVPDGPVGGVMVQVPDDVLDQMDK